MAYIIITNDLAEELDRRELTGGGALIGRAAECDLVIHDILLSRQHCRIEPRGDRWQVVDLQSKNGTHLNGGRVHGSELLMEGDKLRVGRSYLTFKDGPYRSAGEKARDDRVIRPMDPIEALSGTVTDFVLPEESDKSPSEDDLFDACPSSPVPPNYEASLSDSGAWNFDAAEPGADADSAWPGSGGAMTAVAVHHAAGRMRAVPRPLVKTRATSSMGLQAGVDCLRRSAVARAPQSLPMGCMRRAWVYAGLAAVISVASAVVVWGAWVITLQPL